MDFERFSDIAHEYLDGIPAEFKRGLHGVHVLERAKPDPELAGVFRLGEYMDPGFPSLLGSNPGLGRHVVLYYGSFKVLAQGDPGFDWEEQIWETLVHELRHHLESLSGRDDLIQEDTAFLQRLKRERPARGSKDY